MSPYVHTPSITNTIGSAGGRSVGASQCPGCYIDFSTTTTASMNASVITPGSTITNIDCSFFLGSMFGSSRFLRWEVAYTRSVNTGVKVATFVVDGQLINECAILYYCTPSTSPPDYNPPTYNAPALLPSSSVFYIDSVAACVSINWTGAPWFCTRGGSLGWPQSFNLSPAACDHNP